MCNPWPEPDRGSTRADCRAVRGRTILRPMRNRWRRASLCLNLLLWSASLASAQTAPATAPATTAATERGNSRVEDRSTRSDDVVVAVSDASLQVDWRSDGSGERSRITFSLYRGKPLIESIRLGETIILRDVEPSAVLTVGTRDLKPAGWIVFFDNPPRRPHESFPLVLKREAMRVVTEEGRTSLIVDGATAGPFAGELRFTFYPGSRLVRVAMVMSTERPATAYLFDAGLTVAADATPPWKAIAYTDLSDTLARVPANVAAQPARSPQVRARTIMAEGNNGGTLAIVPPPHQYFYPLDYTNNDNTTWLGRDYRSLAGRVGFGVRQSLEGDRRYVPWVNAPPGTRQEMGVFYLLGDGDAAKTYDDVLAYTRGDTFKPLAGRKVFTSHYHVEHTVDFLTRQKFQQSTGVPAGLDEPAFAKRFKQAGVDIVHLGELHLPGDVLKIADRLTLLKTMHDECARLSDDKLLLLPGEEPNVHLGGHWMSFFPRPVYWTLDRAQGQPFVEQHPTLGAVYHVGSSADVLKLMEVERGLMWTAHPRIKSSTGFPDVYRGKEYFKSDRYLGGAWKAMPADYSLPRLGTRVLELLDDMNNWAATPGERKHTPGEVDVFQIDADSELYAHMNVNYLTLDAIPRFHDGWASVLDALRGGRFFTTTGEVLIDSFTVDGKASGEALKSPAGESTVVAKLEWTFPLAYAELISGDGKQVFRQRIGLGDTEALGTRELKLSIDLRGRKWARMEVWDVGTSGAFTQPVWIE